MKGLHEGQHVTLRVGEDRHDARIEVLGDDNVLLGLARPYSFQAGIEAAVESVDARGLHVLKGTLDPHKTEHDLVTLRTQAVENIQRRNFVRVEATCGVELRRGERDPISTFTVNVSGSGFLLAGPDDLEVGEDVGLTVKLAEGQEPLVVSATVMRITQDGHRGVLITEIEEADRERLIHFVFERQRLAPRVRT